MEYLRTIENVKKCVLKKKVFKLEAVVIGFHTFSAAADLICACETNIEMDRFMMSEWNRTN